MEHSFILTVILIPLTVRVAERDVDPAVLDATHVYSPACLAFTKSIVNCFVLFPVSVTITPRSGEGKGSLLKIHVISKGESPFMTEQVRDVASPAFSGSSPKEMLPI